MHFYYNFIIFIFPFEFIIWRTSIWSFQAISHVIHGTIITEVNNVSKNI